MNRIAQIIVEATLAGKNSTQAATAIGLTLDAEFRLRGWFDSADLVRRLCIEDPEEEKLNALSLTLREKFPHSSFTWRQVAQFILEMKQ